MAALNEKDKKWLSSEISKQVEATLSDDISTQVDVKLGDSINAKVAEAVEASRPNGWQRAGENIKAIGTPAAICSVIIAALALAAAGWYQALSRVKDQTRFEDNSTRDMAELKGQMAVLRALVASNAPAKAANQIAAKQLLAEAENKIISPLPESIVQQVGESFTDASSGNPGAWGVALEFASYRSSLISIPKVQLSANGSDLSGLVLTTLTPKDKHAPTILASTNYVPISQAARMDVFFRPSQQVTTQGPAILWLRGGAAMLDSMSMRHVVFQNVEVHYMGHPTQIEDVVFVSCTFVFDNQPYPRALANAILADTHVSLTLGSDQGKLLTPLPSVLARAD